jgi:hypothetical protein
LGSGRSKESEVDMNRIVLRILGFLIVVVIVIFGAVGVPRSQDGPGNLSKIQTASLSEYGIEIVEPSKASFAALMSKHLEKTSRADIGGLKNYSVFVVNDSEKSIAALNVKWELVQRDGRKIAHYRAFGGGLKIVLGTGSAQLSKALGPNDNHLVSLLNTSNSLDGNFRFNMGDGIDIARQLSENVEMTISVDGVLFVDGTFVGPDTRGFFERLKAEIEARTEVLEEFARALNGDSEAMKRIEMLAESDSENNQTSSGKDYSEYQLEKERLIRATLAMRKRWGDKIMLDRINAELGKPRINLRKP